MLTPKLKDLVKKARGRYEVIAAMLRSLMQLHACRGRVDEQSYIFRSGSSQMAAYSAEGMVRKRTLWAATVLKY